MSQLTIRNLIIVLFLTVLVFFAHSVKAQTVVEPPDVYVSKQSPAPNPLFKGNYNAWADEGRMVNVVITDINGPIDVSPKKYTLAGPVCPKYDGKGNRMPETPPPSATAVFSGKITIKSIPASGTTQTAEFKAADKGYYTVCSEGTKKYYDSFWIVKFNIHSLLLKLRPVTGTMCNNGVLYVDKIYPDNVGTVEWKSQKGIFTIEQHDNNHCVIKALKTGEDIIEAKFTVNNVSYSEKIKVKAAPVKFTKDKNDIMWYPNGQINLKDYIEVSKTNDAAFKNSKGNIIDPPILKTDDFIVGTTETVTIYSKSDTGCKHSTIFKFYGFKVVMDMTKVCDGEEAPLHLELTPNDADKPSELLAKLKKIKLEGLPHETSKGNPGNKTKLDFANVSNGKSKILNALWYATTDEQCNDFCTYDITATAQVNNTEVKSTGSAEMTTSAELPSCLDGYANVISPYFSGEFKKSILYNKTSKMWTGQFVGIGSFKRTINVDVFYKAPKKSQFYAMVKNEELYHEKQFKGKAGHLFEPFLNVNNIYLNLISQPNVQAPTKEIVEAILNARSIGAQNDEIQRSGRVYPSVRCAIEKEAKTNVKSSYRLKLECTYPMCH